MPSQARRWTLEEVRALPEDGNRYELVRGHLIVTPAPAYAHERAAAMLTALLVPYVVEHRLGAVYRPQAVFRWRGSETVPDLMVREHAPADTDWNDVPRPILVVEVLSPSTRRDDLLRKRELYAAAGIPEYWIIDPIDVSLEVARASGVSEVYRDEYSWTPAAGRPPLVIRLADLLAP
jgi:Uma2 family endonuclease